MDGIVTGKGVEGTIHFKSAIHQDVAEGSSVVKIATTDASLYFKLMMTDNSVMIGKVSVFKEVIEFSYGTFGENSPVVWFYFGEGHFKVENYYNNSISPYFKYLELGTLS